MRFTVNISSAPGPFDWASPLEKVDPQTPFLRGLFKFVLVSIVNKIASIHPALV